MGEQRKGSGGNSHQRAVRAAATGDPMPARKEVNGIQPMQDDTRRSIFITWGLSLAMLALSWIFGGPYWGVPLLLLGAYLVLRGHFPEGLNRTWVRVGCAVILLGVSLGSIWLSPLGDKWRNHESQSNPVSKQEAPPLLAEPSQTPASPQTSAPAPVPATTPPPSVRADAKRIALRVGNAYALEHPKATQLEVEAVMDKEMKLHGYPYSVRIPPPPKKNPPSLFGGGQNVHLVFNGVTLMDTSPNNGMTAIRTGNRSPVTMNGGGIVGFDNGITTGNDSPVVTTNAPFIHNAPTPPEKKPDATPPQ